MYNPLDKRNLGKSVTDALIDSSVHPLAGRKPFIGAGIYALYYTGNFEAYKPLAELNREGKFMAPIYVGKATPPGAREGKAGLDEGVGPALHERLGQHANSIRKTNSLQVADFFCRYIVTEEIWLSLGESLMIRNFRPVWNVVLSGFGNNVQGGGRAKQRVSKWDTLHPGRGTTLSLESRFEASHLIENIREHLEKAFPRVEDLGGTDN